MAAYYDSKKTRILRDTDNTVTNYGFAEKNVRFSSYLISRAIDTELPNFRTFVKEYPLAGRTTLSSSFTFPNFKERFVVHHIYFDGLPVDSLVSIIYGIKGNSVPIYDFYATHKYYASTMKIDFEKLFGLPMEFKKGDTITLRITLPNNYTPQPNETLLIVGIYS